MTSEQRTAVYIAPIPDCVEITDVFPPERDAEIKSIGNSRVRAEKYCVWKLVEFAVSDMFGREMREFSFKKTAAGKWDCDGFCFSLSHTAGAVAVAVSDSPIGVDVENVSRVRMRFSADRIAVLCADAGVRVPAGYDAYLAFLDAWTKKESIYKKRGDGALPLSINTDEERDVRAGLLRTSPELYLAFCGNGADKADIFLCDSSGEKRLINEMLENFS